MGNFLSDTLGIGIGTVQIRLFEDRIPWGDVIAGRLELSLPEPVDASGVIVGIRARKRSVRRTGRAGTAIANTVVYDVHKELSGARHYGSEGFNFVIPLPSQPPSLRDISRDLADLVTVARAVQGQFDAEPTWVVYGRLARPWKLDLTHEVTIFPIT